MYTLNVYLMVSKSVQSVTFLALKLLNCIYCIVGTHRYPCVNAIMCM